MSVVLRLTAAPRVHTHTLTCASAGGCCHQDRQRCVTSTCHRPQTPDMSPLLLPPPPPHTQHNDMLLQEGAATKTGADIYHIHLPPPNASAPPHTHTHKRAHTPFAHRLCLLLLQEGAATKTEAEMCDIHLLPPNEDPETCASWLRMRNRDGRYTLMFEEWVTEGDFIISPR